MSTVTLAVAALPEEFPVVFTFFLGVGVYRLARRQALVRRAVSVENIGRITTVCSDKTGTITDGRLRLMHLQPADGVVETELLIAMGERGTRSAREVAAIVLLDDNFRTIVQAIGEGRLLFANLRTSFQSF